VVESLEHESDEGIDLPGSAIKCIENYLYASRGVP
jgi:hypothetical protein